jgi:serine/threonine-protein kinase
LGLTEVRARGSLAAIGFEVGEIKYAASESPSGTVIAQSASAYSLLEIGARVDLTVSAGPAFSQKKVPQLYGLTVDEARLRLAEVGLVCGRIYSVQSGSGVATVVSQSIAAGTPITSGTVSIDIYVSS